MTVGVILVTSDKSQWKDIFDESLIFNKLTNEHILRILFLQKIKKSADIYSKIKIFLHNFDLDDFEIDNKLYNILKYQHDLYNIFILPIDNNTLDSETLEEISIYNKKLLKYKKS